jgi:hypothetical protein
MLLSAIFTLIDQETVILGLAAEHGGDHLFVFEWHGLAVEI